MNIWTIAIPVGAVAAYFFFKDKVEKAPPTARTAPTPRGVPPSVVAQAGHRARAYSRNLNALYVQWKEAMPAFGVKMAREAMLRSGMVPIEAMARKDAQEGRITGADFDVIERKIRGIEEELAGG